MIRLTRRGWLGWAWVTLLDAQGCGEQRASGPAAPPPTGGPSPQVGKPAGSPATTAKRPPARKSVAPRYLLEPLPGDFHGPGYAAAFNRAGTVAGQYMTREKHNHACLWREQRLLDLDCREGSWSGARDMNRHGLIVGEFARVAGSAVHGFLWSDGLLSDLGTLGGPDSHAMAINDAGLIAGYARDARGLAHAVVWENRRIRMLPEPASALTGSQALGLNQAGTIVGSAHGMRGGQAMIWNDRKVERLEPPERARSSLAAAVNAAGDAVGHMILDGDSHPHACLWRQGTPFRLHELGFSSTATALNDEGHVGGTFFHQKGGPRAFLWLGKDMLDLTSLVQNAAGMVLRSVRMLDDRGWMVGEGERGGQVIAYLARPR